MPHTYPSMSTIEKIVVGKKDANGNTLKPFVQSYHTGNGHVNSEATIALAPSTAIETSRAAATEVLERLGDDLTVVNNNYGAPIEDDEYAYDRFEDVRLWDMADDWQAVNQCESISQAVLEETTPNELGADNAEELIAYGGGFVHEAILCERNGEEWVVDYTIRQFQVTNKSRVGGELDFPWVGSKDDWLATIRDGGFDYSLEEPTEAAA